MPKEKPPRFPVGLTLDEAVARGWVPGSGRPLIVTDDGLIREVGPDDHWLDPADQPRRRRHRSKGGSDTAMGRVKAVMARYRAAQRERRREWKIRRVAKTTAMNRGPPVPTEESYASLEAMTFYGWMIERAADIGMIIRELELAGADHDDKAFSRKRGFLDDVGEVSPFDIEAAVFAMISAAFDAGVRAKPETPPPALEAAAPRSRARS
jgi:hypothetical protein